MTTTDRIKALHKELRANYSSNWDAEKDALYARVLSEMAGEVGIERLRQAVNNCINHQPYLSVHILRMEIPAPAEQIWTPSEEERRKADEAKSSPEAKEFFALLKKLGVRRVDLA